ERDPPPLHAPSVPAGARLGEGEWVEEPACKPDSVPAGVPVEPVPAGGDHPSGSRVAATLLQPTREHRTGRPLPAWPCSGWGLPSRPVTRSAGELLPHRFTLAGAGAGKPPRSRQSVLCGTFRGSPRLGVTQHPALWSPDFPRCWSSRPPAPRPPGRLLTTRV